MNKLVETQLRAKHLRKSTRTLKKFFVFIGAHQYIGHDISEEGVSFSFNSYDYITLLKHQKTTISIYFLNSEQQLISYEAAIKIANLRSLSHEQMLYGCQIIDTSTPSVHQMLVAQTPPDYPSLEAIYAHNTAQNTAYIPTKTQTPLAKGLAKTKQQRNEILRESAELIKFLRRQSVNEAISCDDFRELALTITNQIVENDWFKKIETW